MWIASAIDKHSLYFQVDPARAMRCLSAIKRLPEKIAAECVSHIGDAIWSLQHQKIYESVASTACYTPEPVRFSRNVSIGAQQGQQLFDG